MKRHIIFKLLLFICLISVEYLATTTSQIKVVAYSWDKLNHFTAFFVLYTLMSLAYKDLSIFSKFLLLLLLAFQIEIVQSYIPNRDFSMLDILADLAGAIFGILFYKYGSIKRLVTTNHQH